MPKSKWPFDPLPPLSFSVLVVDPPTPFDLYSENGAEKSASKHYETMPWEELAALPVGQLARGDCLLLMWATGCALPHSLDLMKAWGFVYKSEMIWRKVTRNGKVRMGPGYRVRTMHEPILLGTIGEPAHKPFPSIFDGLAREHSRKPEEFYSLVAAHTPGAVRRADLFSRQTRAGFTGWGREATKFDQPAAA
jgi:N6-adenosine-specific RNA methylase IME4